MFFLSACLLKKLTSHCDSVLSHVKILQAEFLTLHCSDFEMKEPCCVHASTCVCVCVCLCVLVHFVREKVFLESGVVGGGEGGGGGDKNAVTWLHR